jgi:hypothetical protein
MTSRCRGSAAAEMGSNERMDRRPLHSFRPPRQRSKLRRCASALGPSSYRQSIDAMSTDRRVYQPNTATVTCFRSQRCRFAYVYCRPTDMHGRGRWSSISFIFTDNLPHNFCSTIALPRVCRLPKRRSDSIRNLALPRNAPRPEKTTT